MPNLETPDEVQPTSNRGNVIEIENNRNVDPQQFSDTFNEEINNHNSNNPEQVMTWIPSQETVLANYEEIRNNAEQQAYVALQRFCGGVVGGVVGNWLANKPIVVIVLGGVFVGFVIWAETNCCQQSWYIKKIKSIINECMTKEQKKMMSYIGESALASGLFAVTGWGMRVGFSTAFKNIAVGAYAINPIFGAVVYSTCWLMEWELYVGTLISPAVMPWVIYENYYGEKRHGVILTEESLDYLKIGNDNY